MPADLLIRNATLPDGRTGIDLLAQGGLNAALAPALPAPPGAQVIDASGAMLNPPCVDAHFHLDATLSHGLPRVNASGTLLEGIALWAHLLSQKLELGLGMLWINRLQRHRLKCPSVV